MNYNKESFPRAPRKRALSTGLLKEIRDFDKLWRTLEQEFLKEIMDFNKESCFKVHLKRILLFRELGGLGIGFLKEIIDLNKESSPSLEDCLKEITDFNKESPPKKLS